MKLERICIWSGCDVIENAAGGCHAFDDRILLELALAAGAVRRGRIRSHRSRQPLC